MRYIKVFVLILIMISLNNLWAEFKYNIGNYGAQLLMDEKWKSVKISQDFGKDQFVYEMKNYLVIFEDLTFLKTDDDYMKYLDKYFEGFKNNLKNVTITKLPVRQVKEQLFYGIIAQGTINNIKFSYYINVTGRNGLNHIFFSWALLSGQEDLMKNINDLFIKFSYSDNITYTEKLKKKDTKTLEFKNFDLYLPYLTSFLHEEKDNEVAEFNLISDNKNINILCFNLTGYNSPDKFLDNLPDVISDKNIKFTEQKRTNVTIKSQKAKLAVFKSDKGFNYSVWSLAFYPENNKIFEIRFISYSDYEGVNDFFDKMIKDITIVDKEDIDAFSIDSSNMNKKKLSENQRLLLQSASLLGRFDNNVSNLFYDEYKKGIWGSSGNDIYNFDLNNSNLNLYYSLKGDDYINSFVLMDKKLLINANNNLIEVVDSKETVQENKYKSISSFYSDSFFAIKDNIFQNNYYDYENLNSDNIVNFDKNKKEKIILSSNSQIKVLVSSFDNKTIMYGMSPRWDNPDGISSSTTILNIINMTSSKPINAGIWEYIDSITMSKNGWLINGRPANQQSGLFFVKISGDIALLISGNDFKGVYIDSDYLIAASNLCDSSHEYNWNYEYIYKIPLISIKKYGHLINPLQENEINEIGEKISIDLPLNFTNGKVLTKSDIDNIFKKAQEISKKIKSIGLPDNSSDFDEMINSFSNNSKINDYGFNLLRVISIKILTDYGAIWIPDNKKFNDNKSLAFYSSPFSINVDISEIIKNALYDSEGLYNPIQTIMENANGREILLGISNSVLIEEMNKRFDVSLKTLFDKIDQEKIYTFIFKYNSNLYLRKSVYEELLNRKADKVILYIIDKLSKNHISSLIDKKFFYLLTINSNINNQDRLKYISDIKNIIINNQNDYILYYYLGKLYGKDNSKESKDKAKLCYKKIIDSYSNEKLKDKAQKELDFINK